MQLLQVPSPQEKLPDQGIVHKLRVCKGIGTALYFTFLLLYAVNPYYVILRLKINKVAQASRSRAYDLFGFLRHCDISSETSLIVTWAGFSKLLLTVTPEDSAGATSFEFAGDVDLSVHPEFAIKMAISSPLRV